MENNPVRIRLSRAKGYRMPEGTVKIDRSTIFGNPFTVALCGRTEAVRLHRRWLCTSEPLPVTELEMVELSKRKQDVFTALHELRGKNLACWCHDNQPCHGNTLLEMANAEPPDLHGPHLRGLKDYFTGIVTEEPPNAPRGTPESAYHNGWRSAQKAMDNG